MSPFCQVDGVREGNVVLDLAPYESRLGQAQDQHIGCCIELAALLGSLCAARGHTHTLRQWTGCFAMVGPAL